MSYNMVMMSLRVAEQRRGGGVGPEAELDGGVGPRVCACGGKHFSCWINVGHLQAMMIGRKAAHPSVQTAPVSANVCSSFTEGRSRTKRFDSLSTESFSTNSHVEPEPSYL